MSNYKYRSINPDDFSFLPMCILKDDYAEQKRTTLISINNIVRSKKKHMLNSMSRQLNAEYVFSNYHFHEGIEILRINGGSARVIINDKKYDVKENDILIINPFENHGIYLMDRTADFSRTCVIFEPTDLFPAEKENKLLFDKLRALRFPNFISCEHPASAELCECIDHTVELAVTHTAGWPIAVFSNLVMFYSIIVREGLQTEETDSIPYQYGFVLKVAEFIDRNIGRELSTEEISEYCGYSVGHFCRLFKKCFNRSFKEYLNICRIENAKALLGTTPTFSEVYKAVGFNNANHFSNTFKRYEGVTPSEYLKKNHHKKGQQDELPTV